MLVVPSRESHCKHPSESAVSKLLCVTNAVVTCEIKLFQNYFSFRRRPSEIHVILFQRVETCPKLF